MNINIQIDKVLVNASDLSELRLQHQFLSELETQLHELFAADDDLPSRERSSSHYSPTTADAGRSIPISQTLSNQIYSSYRASSIQAGGRES